MPGLRLVEIAQMHVTVHFIGEADSAALTEELQKLSPGRFDLHLDGVGHFRSPNGAKTLWAGCENQRNCCPSTPQWWMRYAAVSQRKNVPTRRTSRSRDVNPTCPNTW